MPTYNMHTPTILFFKSFTQLTMAPPKSLAKMYYFRRIVLIFWIVVMAILIILYLYVPDIFRDKTLQSLQDVVAQTSITQNPQPNPQKIEKKEEENKASKFIRSTLNMFSPSPPQSDINFVSEPYHDPRSRCHLPIDLNHTNPKIQYTNQFPSEWTIEQIIAKRSEPVENIPMCPNADKANFDQYQNVVQKLPHNLLAYVNRCQINAVGRGKRQFGGLLSGDPLFPDLSTQVGFLHVYKSGICKICVYEFAICNKICIVSPTWKNKNYHSLFTNYMKFCVCIIRWNNSARYDEQCIAWIRKDNLAFI